MILYKYLSPDRRDVIENLSIRFTQPVYLNDPYETNPVITGSEMTDEQWAKIADFEARKNGINIKDFEHLKNKDARDNQFPAALQLMKTFFHHSVGILSLSETHDNTLMWAHYCQNHTGFVIGFKTGNSFLSPTGKQYAVNTLSKVIYTDTRPVNTLEKTTMKDLYFTKSNHWSYESEWRILKNRQDTSEKSQTGEIFLYRFPADIIDSVYFGGACDPALEKNILEQLQLHGLKTPVFKMMLNTSNYNITGMPYDKWKVLEADLMKDNILTAIDDIKKYLYSQ
jgi:hypothetical protein